MWNGTENTDWNAIECQWHVLLWNTVSSCGLSKKRDKHLPISEETKIIRNMERLASEETIC